MIQRHLQNLKRTGAVPGSSGGSPTQSPVSPADLLRFIAQLSPKGGDVMAGLHHQLASNGAFARGDNPQLPVSGKNSNAQAGPLGLPFASASQLQPQPGGGSASPLNQMGFFGHRAVSMGGGSRGGPVPQVPSTDFRGTETSPCFSFPQHRGGEKMTTTHTARGSLAHRPSAMGTHEDAMPPHFAARSSCSLNATGLPPVPRNMDMSVLPHGAGSKDTLNGCMSYDVGPKRLASTETLEERVHDTGATDRLARPLGNASTSSPFNMAQSGGRSRVVGTVPGASVSQGGANSAALQQRLAHVLARETGGEGSPQLARAFGFLSPTQRRSGEMLGGSCDGGQGEQKGFDMRQADVLLKVTDRCC